MINVDEIVKKALSFVGQKENGANNSGFEDPEFEELLRSFGWLPGQNWCAYAQMAVLQGLIPEDKFKLLSPSVNSIYWNFKSYNKKCIVKTVEIGHLAIFQVYKNGKPTWMGHIGLVTSIVDDITFKSAEGNGNSKGGSRGDEFVNIPRKLDFSPKKNGLVLRELIDLTK